MQKKTFQVLDKNDLPIGAAFLIDDDLLLTCAHVVRASGSAPGQDVSLRTPKGTQLNATIEDGTWRDEDAEDIATLRLAAPLDEMQPLPLRPSSGSKGHTFSTYGFPKPDQSLSGSGTITGYATLNNFRYLQLESRQVTPGFSGAPVFDEVTQRVVGMVVAIAPPDEYQRQGTTAFAVPAETLPAIVPELQLSEQCPYRSLDAFTEADAGLFFGRERVVAKLLESLKRNPRFLAVLGPSGCGKSSVVQAGLIPALRNGQLSGSEKWGILSVRPGTQPFEQLASAGMSDPKDLVQAASDWLAAHPQNERLLILIDQFEELLVSTPSNTRTDFVAALADLLDSSLPVTVLLTLRDDFYNCFTQDAGVLVDWMEAALVNIPPTLEEAELREIIARPARDLGLRFAPGLVDAILADARTADPSGRAIRSTVLPLLEFALTQLWERRVEGELIHDAYRAMGGVTGGLSQWADRAYYALSEANEGQRAIARRVFSELVTLGDETQGIADTRRVRSIAELTAKDSEATKAVLDALVAARLLVARHDEGSGQDTVEIIHETLLQEWALLNGWLQEDRQFLLWREGLRASQQAWMEIGQDAGALLRGVPLAEAEGWLEKRGDDLGDAEKEYITKSTALRKRSERNRRWVMAGLGLVAVVMAGLAFWGSSSATEAREQAATAEAERIRAEEQNKIAVARQLAAQAELQLEQSNDSLITSTLLGIESLLLAPSLEGDKVVRDALSLLPIPEVQINDPVGTAVVNSDWSWIFSANLDNEGSFIDIETGSIVNATQLHDKYAADSIAYSLDSRWVAVVIGNTIQIWDVMSGTEKFQFQHESFVYDIAFSPDSRLLVSGSGDNIMKLWNVITGQELLEMQHEDIVASVDFSPNNKWIASGSYDGTVRIWEVSTGLEISRIQLTEPVSEVVFSPNGNWLASASQDSVQMWLVPTLTETAKMRHNDTVYELLFSSDSNWLISSSQDNTIRIWETSIGNELIRIEHDFGFNEDAGGYDEQVFNIAISPNGKFIASGGYDGVVRVWNTQTGLEVTRVYPDVNRMAEDAAFVIAFSPDSRKLASVHRGFEGGIWIWKLNHIYHDDTVFAIDFSSDSHWLISGSQDNTAKVWEVSTSEETTSVISDSPVYSVDFSPNGSWGVSGGKENSAQVWIVETGEKISSFQHEGIVYSVAFSPDGKLVASGDYEGNMYVWEARSAKEIAHIHHNGPVNLIKFSPDGSLVASGSYDSTIRVCNLATGREIAVMAHDYGSVRAIAFSPNGELIVSGGGDNTARIWSVSSGKEVAKFDYGIFDVYDVAYSPNGKYVALASQDNTVRIWDVSTNQEINRMYHDELVTTVVFSQDGSWLASGSYDNTVRVWEVETGKEIIRIPQDDHVFAIAFSQDDQFLASGDRSGRIQISLWKTDDVITNACQRVNRNLTTAEWEKFIGSDIPYSPICDPTIYPNAVIPD